MILCPICRSESNRVQQTYNDVEGRDRKRYCLSCGTTFLSKETVLHVMARGRAQGPPEPVPAAAPKEKAPAKAVAKFYPATHDNAGEVFGSLPLPIQTSLLFWWNIARKQRHPSAAWTELAWSQSVGRVSDLLQQQGVQAAALLAAAGSEHGWQSLKSEYVNKDEVAGLSPKEDPAVSAINNLLARAADA